MIVVCVDVGNFNKKYALTIGKQYHIVRTKNDLIFVENDHNEIGGYLKTRFITLEEKRDNTLNEILYIQ